MKYIVQITDCGPLSFRAGREKATVETLSYVSGSTLLGGLASAHVALRRDPDEFNAFFMNGGASFGNLYPASFKLAILLHFLIKTNLSTSNCVYDCFMQHRLPVC